MARGTPPSPFPQSPGPMHRQFRGVGPQCDAVSVGQGHGQPAQGLTPRVCPTCGEVFQPYRDFQRACSRRCRDKLPPTNDAPHAKTVHFVCELCGAESSARSTVGAGQFKWCADCKPAAREARQQRKNESRKQRWNDDPEYREHQKALSRRSRYGIERAEYERMLDEQSGCCAICDEPPDPDGVRAASRLHVDHNHTTGAVRALLCNKCNRGLGYFQDDPVLLQAAIRYLERFDGQESL